jgi:hypothetical protein
MQELGKVGREQRCLEVEDCTSQGPDWAVAPQEKKEKRNTKATE